MPEERSAKSRPGWIGAAIAIAAIGVVVAAMAFFKREGRSDGLQAREASAATASCRSSAGASPTTEAASAPVEATAQARTPRLVDLGAGKCVPCKAMAPILEELKRSYEGSLSVEFIDVWERREEAAKYGVSMIPTQLFIAADGKELFRHEGFYSKEEILAKCAELGFKLKAK